MPSINQNLIGFTRKKRPSGTQLQTPFKELTNKEKEVILKRIKLDWKELIRLHFEAEGGITTTGAQRNWKPLSKKYVEFKRQNDLLPGILEASEPNLMKRYQDSITYRSQNFSIIMYYPDLVTGPSRQTSHFAHAGVHQLGQIRRPIIKRSFILSGRNRVVEYYTKGK